eukprot:TRINITY_DN14147_c0_g1_i2.p2 TRINITY_DN14147_c0_g1~~TRINITY_DN14147_c0_g1_i2.p2  ORF type:complete len:130 (+),score=30.86 TRINITY_DN14147_c0_g1_i2:440-829(+)
MEQVTQLFQVVNGEDANVILGDLNALSRKDYSDAYWEQINATRKENCWEYPAKHQVIDWIVQNGYQDFVQHVHPVQDQNIQTCQFGTRVDHIFISKTLSSQINWNTSSCQILSDFKESDHYPIIAKLHF